MTDKLWWQNKLFRGMFHKRSCSQFKFDGYVALLRLNNQFATNFVQATTVQLSCQAQIFVAIIDVFGLGFNGIKSGILEHDPWPYF